MLSRHYISPAGAASLSFWLSALVGDDGSIAKLYFSSAVGAALYKKLKLLVALWPHVIS